MKTCVIDVGGGLRGIYGAGVLDRCIDDGVHFDTAIGVSAGSANLASFLAGQRERNYKFYTTYSLRPEYMGARRFLRDGEYLGLDYIYGTLSNADGEDALDLPALLRTETDLFVSATNTRTGAAVFFTKADFQPDDYRILSASCAIPIICRPQKIGDEEYYDGGIADPVPVQKALQSSADRIVLILTRPPGTRLDGKSDRLCARLLQNKNPTIAALLRLRRLRYQRSVALAEALAANGSCLIVAPANECGVQTLTRNPEKLDRLYNLGVSDGARIAEFLQTETAF